MPDQPEETLPEQPPETKANQPAPVTDPAPIAPNPETETMEVHHHTHPAHGKKTWKDYFWEFLMLFLAVFCGFLAEYQLEHKIEKDRVNEYAQSFIADLALDTLQFENTANAKLFREQKLDTLIQLLSDTTKTPDDTRIYYYSKFLFRDFAFHTFDATFQQVRNSGGLRYIKNKDLLKKLSFYYTGTIWVENDYNYFQTRRTFNFEVLKLTSQLFAAPEYARLLSDSLETNNEEIHMPTAKIKLISRDRNLLNQLASYAVLAIEDSRDFRKLGNFFLKPEAAALINILKKEYKIDQ